MAAANWYAEAVVSALGGHIAIGTHVIKAALLTSSHTPALASNTLFSDVSGNEASGTNYSAGGAIVTTPALTPTAANSWGGAAAVSTVYTVGQVVRPLIANGNLYRCETAGTSGGTAPAWPTTFGATVADGSVTWTNIGTSLVQFTADATVWSNLTCANFRYITYYDSVTGYVIAEHDLGSTQNVTATNVTYTPDATGVGYAFIA